MAKKAKSATGPHDRTEQVFERLKQRTNNEDVRVMLDAMCWIGTLIEEVGLSIQSAQKELGSDIDEICEKLDDAKG